MRPVRLSTLALLLVLSASALSACQRNPPRAPITNRLELRDGMRELWTAHVTLTRIYVISALADLPDNAAATERLLQNQDDIGDAIRPFYGDAAGDQLSALLREHILGAAAVLTAARAGDTAQLQIESDAWYANGDAIAGFLADANPAFDFDDLSEMMRTHLDQLVAEVTARLTGDWEGDVAAYDATVVHIDHMADALADGIATQFPDLVAPSPLSERDEELHVGMRALWADHVTSTRVFLVVTVADLPDAPVATARLLRNQDDIGDAMRPFYGDAAADQLTALLHDHITGAAEVVAAAAAGDSGRLDQATRAWFANSDQIAAFLASANPAWVEADLRAAMHEHLETTTAEAVARLDGDWAGDIAAYDEVVHHILDMADVLSAGIAVQFPDD